MVKRKNLFNRKTFTILISLLFLLSLFVPHNTDARRRYRYRSRYKSLQARPTPAVLTADVEATTTPTPMVEQNNVLTGQWKYLPGASVTEEGLVINAMDIALVEQDGRKAATNPPINAAGTYLKDIVGDFMITADMQIPKGTTATMQLYGNLPIIADEFKIDRPSLQMAITDGELAVKAWDANGNPTVSDAFSIPMDGMLSITVKRQASTIQFVVNDIVIGSIRAGSVFTNGKLWFGFDSSKGSWVVSRLRAEPVGSGTFTIADGSVLEVTQHNPLGLQALASKKRPGFKVGMAMALNPAVSDAEYANLAFDSAMFGSMTPENDMKMINLQPQPGVYTFQRADALVNLAKQNGVQDIHGHTLVFGEANPVWFTNLPVRTSTDKQKIEKIMVDHITTVIKHFGDSVQSWDVVNEPLADYDEFTEDNIYRNHKWYQAMGESYIIKAFEAAYAANPKAILSINEYGLEADDERWEGFLRFIRQFKRDLQASGIPLNNISIGFQAHVYEAGDKIDPEVLRNHIQTLGALGFKVQISENDVYSDDGASIQAEQYASILDVCISEENCIAWRGWILSDRYDVFRDDDGSIQYGVDGLFSKSMQPRPAVKAMQGVLQ